MSYVPTNLATYISLIEGFQTCIQAHISLTSSDMIQVFIINMIVVSSLRLLHVIIIMKIFELLYYAFLRRKYTDLQLNFRNMNTNKWIRVDHFNVCNSKALLYHWSIHSVKPWYKDLINQLINNRLTHHYDNIVVYDGASY